MLPTWRGQNEQSMALAADRLRQGQARRQIMVAASSIGPGATNMVTAAGVAHANRLPVLLLSGDTFANRIPDPVLQQVEHFGDPTITVNDAFKAVTRYWDRIARPEQILRSLPQAVATMLDPADCGPAFLALCQDVQGEAFDYPERVLRAAAASRSARPRPDAARDRRGRCAAAQGQEAADHRRRRRALFAGARRALAAFAEQAQHPGRRDHRRPRRAASTTIRMNVGPLGVIGSTSANALAAEADVVLAIGTRLQDFTTGSWTVFGAGRPAHRRSTPPASTRTSTARWRSSATPQDGARRALGGRWRGWRRPRPGADARRQGLCRAGTRSIDTAYAARPTPSCRAMPRSSARSTARPATTDLALTAAGGLPGELDQELAGEDRRAPSTASSASPAWATRSPAAGAPRWPTPTRDVIVMVGDGSYLMMNSDIYSLGAHRPQADRRASATMAASPSSTGCRTSRACPPSTT